MSSQLRSALAAATFEEVDTLRRILTEAAELADLATDPTAPLYRALLVDLDCPALTYRADLVGAAVTAPEAADAVVRDLLSVGQPLTYALARELGAATRAGRDEQAGFARRLADTDTVPSEWT
jgi:hypothetical protein